MRVVWQKQTSIFKHMIDSNTTICLTLAGAITPAGMGRAIKIMIEKGFVDWIVSTGANIYHDLHFAYGLPVHQGHFNVDDDILYSKQIVRIYDVYIKETGTLQAQDIIVQNDVRNGIKNTSDLNSTADISHTLGKAAKANSHFPEKSFTVAAFENDIPIYIPAISDSSIGLNMLPLLFDDQPMPFNVINDVAESAPHPLEVSKIRRIGAGRRRSKKFFSTNRPGTIPNTKTKGRGSRLHYPVD